MKKGESQKASIQIAGKDYPLNLNNQEMKNLRRIEKEINEAITQFSTQFENIGIRDCISLVLIQKAFELEQLKESTVKESIHSVLDEIEDALQS